MKVENYPVVILIMIVCFSLGVFVTEISHQAFPLKGTEVETDSESVGTSEKTQGVGSSKILLSPPLASFLKKEFGDEYETIMAAALRNRCQGENLHILFAIRKAENGGPGIEFGVEAKRGTDLDTQAGWAAATIMKNRSRWYATNTRGDFIEFLGKRYCPNNSEVWIKNVKYWFDKFKENAHGKGA